MKKVKVAVLSGGPSSEHEVSLNTAKNVIKALDLNKFEIYHFKIGHDRIWAHQESNLELTEEEGLKFLKKQSIDLVFIAMHGEFGEDGTIQAILENEGLKYTGSNSKASALAMDKFASSQVLTHANLLVPSFICINISDWENNPQKNVQAVLEGFDLPMVVKPVDRGSSVGTKIVHKRSEIEGSINEAFKYSENVMIQEFILGREVTCAVLEGKNGEDIPLIPTEIIPDKTHDFFDYHAKYAKGASIEITPPDLPEETIKEIQKQSAKAHASIGCAGISRSDFILKDNDLYILEINTIPGMTETSLLPQGAAAMGIDFTILIETIIESALRK